MRKQGIKKSELCISIATKPGMFGTIIHNAGFKTLGIDFHYQAFCTNDLEGTITGIRALGIRGCGVSMPYKEKVIRYLDSLDSSAIQVKAVNTIVNNKGFLTGYNTDVLSLIGCLKKFKPNKKQQILVLGAGGMSRAILVSLNYLKMKNIRLTNRTSKKGEKLANEFDLEFIPWKERNNFQTDMIINTTSIGMYPEISSTPLSNNIIKNSKMVVDVISNPQFTKLIKLAKKYKKNTILGTELAFQQAIAQFKLYTRKNPPIIEMQKAVNQYYKKRN